MSLYAASVGGWRPRHADWDRESSPVMVSMGAAGSSFSASHKRRSFAQELMLPFRRVMELSTWPMPKSYAVNGVNGYGIILRQRRIRTSYFGRIRTSYFYFNLRGLLNGTIDDTASIHLTQSDPPWHRLNLNQHKTFCLPWGFPLTSSRGLPCASVASIWLVDFYAPTSVSHF